LETVSKEDEALSRQGNKNGDEACPLYEFKRFSWMRLSILGVVRSCTAEHDRYCLITKHHASITKASKVQCWINPRHSLPGDWIASRTCRTKAILICFVTPRGTLACDWLCLARIARSLRVWFLIFAVHSCVTAGEPQMQVRENELCGT
jgi:hypothetical protein